MSETTTAPATPNPGDRIAELEARLAEFETQATQRLVQADLKTHALRAGMIDLDGLKLLDSSKLKLDPKGEVENAATIMAELKRNKPYLFQPATTSSTSPTPPTTQPTAKRATEMTHAEWQSARAALLKHR